MLKNVTQLLHTINGKLYQFSCDMDSPLEHVKESLFQYLKYVGQIEDQVKAAQEASKPAENVSKTDISPVSETPTEEVSNV